MDGLRAGFARRDITQPLGTPSLFGMFTSVTEIWDPLTATAVVLEQGGERVALVGLDLCGLLEASHRTIRQTVMAATGIAADHVVLNVSHSHSAPYISMELQELLRPLGIRLQDEDYAVSLQQSVAEAVGEAADRAVPVRVAVGRGLVERVAANKRPKLPDGRTVHRFGRPPEDLRALPEGLIDPQVSVLRFDRSDGRALGAILSYSCHPTASSVGIPTWVSADFVGHGRAKIEQALDLTCVFLQGCAGNQGTGKWVAGTAWEDTVAMGDRFARGVADGLRSARAIEDGALKVVCTWLPLELDPFPPATEMENRLQRAAHDRACGRIVVIGDSLVLAHRLDELSGAPITAITIGRDLAIVVLPGEVYLEHGLAIRAGSGFSETVVAAYNDNTLQYIPTSAAFTEGGYEVEGDWRYIRKGEGERVVEEAVRLLGGLRP